MTPDYRLDNDDAAVHTDWDRDLDPVLTVESGDVVEFTCWNDIGPAITPETESAELPDIPFVGHHLTGPVGIAGATPGDVLQVELLEIEHHGWGYSLVRSGEKGLGLLPEEFEDPFLYHWDLDGDVGHFEDGIDVPLDPFPGVVGVAPAAAGPLSTTPPRRVGGNLDTKHYTAGSSLLLPVEVEGGLFSVGDGHAAQGDGEVCVSAIETITTVTARLSVRTDISVAAPEFRTDGPFNAGRSTSAYGTSGVADDLMTAARDATRSMIRRLVADRDLTQYEAYVLCSVMGDLKINEIVDEPNWVVSMYLPATLFD